MKKFYEIYSPINYHSEEISDIVAESMDEGEHIDNEKKLNFELKVLKMENTFTVGRLSLRKLVV